MQGREGGCCNIGSMYHEEKVYEAMRKVRGRGEGRRRIKCAGEGGRML